MRITRWLAFFYAALLRLYPSEYRLEFGDEMQIVFRDAVVAALLDGRLPLLVVLLRELRDCPRNLVAEHWSQIRRRFTEKVQRSAEEGARAPGMVPESVSALAYATALLTGRNTAAGRLFDLLFAAFWVLLTAPLLLFIAVLIKLDSGGPVFFLQERAGWDGQRFTMYKLRSMEIVGETADDENPPSSAGKDRRLTRVGRIIRKFHLDEIPQLINVVKGDMRILGPRPELP